ncbi:hypothetical protein LINGRAHAP2_LOCUS30593, partial [Linum grandiflorum]
TDCKTGTGNRSSRIPSTSKSPLASWGLNGLQNWNGK